MSLKDIPQLNSASVILPAAFRGTSIECVDLSNALCFKIYNEAFADSKLKAFIPGYFPIDIDSDVFVRTPYGESNK